MELGSKAKKYTTKLGIKELVLRLPLADVKVVRIGIANALESSL